MLEWNTYLSNSETQLTWELKGVTFCHKNESIKHLFYWHFVRAVWGSSYLLIVTVFEKKHIYSPLRLFIGFAHGLLP
jgi:hypothetical protein